MLKIITLWEKEGLIILQKDLKPNRPGEGPKNNNDDDREDDDDDDDDDDDYDVFIW